MDNKEIDFLIAFDKQDEMSDGRMADAIRFLCTQLQEEIKHANRLAEAINTGSEITYSQVEMLRVHAERRK